jgi:hypothetical protein
VSALAALPSTRGDGPSGRVIVPPLDVPPIVAGGAPIGMKFQNRYLNKELLALRSDDIDFDASTIRVDESVDRLGHISPCRNVAAYCTVVLADKEGQYAMQALKHIKQDGLIFRSKRGGLTGREYDSGSGLCTLQPGNSVSRRLACMRSVAVATVVGNFHEYRQQ